MPEIPLTATLDTSSPAPPTLEKLPSLKSLRLRGLVVTLPLVMLGFCLVASAFSGIFVAIQIRQIDPENFIGSFALVIGVGSITAMISTPIIGTISDRTRTRLGPRIPFLIIGALATLLICIAFGFANNLVLLIVLTFLLQISLPMTNGPLATYIPEHVPLGRRGLFSSAFGLAALVGALAGQSVGAAFATYISTGYIVVAVVLVIFVAIFVVTNARGADNRGRPVPAFSWGKALHMFWVNPKKHPDFAWAFSGRFLLSVGYFMIVTYQLYILQDYIKLGDDAVGVIPLIGLVNLAAIIVATPIAGILSDKFHRRKVIVFVAGVLLALGMVFPVVMPTVTGMILYSIVGGLGFGAWSSVDFALVSEVLPSSDDVGKDLGIINITSTLPQTMAAAFASVIVALFGGFAGLFIVAALCVLAGAALVAPIKSIR